MLKNSFFLDIDKDIINELESYNVFKIINYLILYLNLRKIYFLQCLLLTIMLCLLFQF